MRKKGKGILLVLGVGVMMAVIGWKELRWKLDWQPVVFQESSDFLSNQERGFYNMRGVLISDEQPVVETVWNSIREEKTEETLELLQIHIGNYRDRKVSDSGMEQIRRTFEAYREKEKQVKLIVRFLYDWDGAGAASDPSSINIVLTHMEQMGEVMEAYADQIYIVQGVFVGSWAEMHSSRYLTEENYLRLVEKMNEVVPDSAFLAVRMPAYWRMAARSAQPLTRENAWDMSRISSRLSLFNDGILGNASDCGTYGDIPRENSSSLDDKWIREDELKFQEQLNLYVPNGGEVVLDNEWNDLENADETMEIMHISYINKGHDVNVLEKWKNSVCRDEGSVYDGMSGYDYIERHLGYRFVVRGASLKTSGWKWEDGSLSVMVENVGYAPRYTPCLAEIIFRNRESGEEYTVPAAADVRDWKPGETVSFAVGVPFEKEGSYEVFLRVMGKADQTAVLFANEGAAQEDGSVFLGTVRKGD